MITNKPEEAKELFDKNVALLEKKSRGEKEADAAAIKDEVENPTL